MNRSSAMTVAKKFRDILQREGIHVHSMMLFGSVARKEDTVGSDIDIAVICEPFMSHRMDEMGRLSQVASALDSRIEAVALRPDDLENKYSTIVQEIKRDGILV